MSVNSMTSTMNNPNFNIRSSIACITILYWEQYDNNYQKIMIPNNNPYFPPQSSNIYSNNFNSSSIALFNIPNDATNSLYVDGVPNDTN